MAYIFDITVSASLEDGDLISRILDFKEDLYRECFRGYDVSVSDSKAIDSVLAPVTFSVSSKGSLARFSTLLKKLMASHGVADVVHVTRR